MTEKKTSGLEPLSLADWVIQRGMLGFGPLAALGALLARIYDGNTPSWPDAFFQSSIWVFLCGPLWGLFMWWWSSRRARAAADPTKAE